MKDDNCIFCKLANGDIPTNTIYEDADFRVILDASPATKGHVLILPKQHYANMFEIDDAVREVYADREKYIRTMSESGQMDSIGTILKLIESVSK